MGGKVGLEKGAGEVIQFLGFVLDSSVARGKLEWNGI